MLERGREEDKQGLELLLRQKEGERGGEVEEDVCKIT